MKIWSTRFRRSRSAMKSPELARCLAATSSDAATQVDLVIPPVRVCPELPYTPLGRPPASEGRSLTTALPVEVVQHHLLPACSNSSLVPLLHTSRSLRRLAANEIRRRLLPLTSGLAGDRTWSREEAFVTWHDLVLELCEGCEILRGRRQPFFEENLCTRCAVPAYFRLLPRISRSNESPVIGRMLMKLSSGKTYITTDANRELSNAFHRFSSSAGSERAANRRAVYMAAHETEWVRHYR